MGVVDMDVDKLADEVTDMVVDRTNFTDVILVLWLWYVWTLCSDFFINSNGLRKHACSTWPPYESLLQRKQGEHKTHHSEILPQPKELCIFKPPFPKNATHATQIEGGRVK